MFEQFTVFDDRSAFNDLHTVKSSGPLIWQYTQTIRTIRENNGAAFSWRSHANNQNNNQGAGDEFINKATTWLARKAMQRSTFSGHTFSAAYLDAYSHNLMCNSYTKVNHSIWQPLNFVFDHWRHQTVNKWTSKWKRKTLPIYSIYWYRSK